MVSPDSVPPPTRAGRPWVPERLTLVRELRGLTRAELAEAIGKSAAAVGQYEAGVIKPNRRVTSAIASALDAPTDLLRRAPYVRALDVEDHFMRPSRAVSQVARRKSAAASALLGELHLRLREFFPDASPSDGPALPRVKLSAGNAGEFELIAEGLRAQWNLANQPVPDMVALLESRSVMVMAVDDAELPTGSFSTWHGEQPWVFLTKSVASASQARLDAAHELGHLVIHAREDILSPDAEREADRFALAFLMPRREFEVDCPARVTQAVLGTLKRRWGVPMAEIVRRGYDLDLLSEASFRRAHARLNRATARANEGDEPQREAPHALVDLIGAARDQGALNGALEAMGMSKALLRELVGYAR